MMLFKKFLIALAAAQLVTSSSKVARGSGPVIGYPGNDGGAGNPIINERSSFRNRNGRDPYQVNDYSSLDERSSNDRRVENDFSRDDGARFSNNIANVCGAAMGDPAQQMAKLVTSSNIDSNGMAMISPGGMLTMTLKQPNEDEAGPYECKIESTGTRTGTWTELEMTTNVPDKNSQGWEKSKDFPLTAKIPGDQTCTGSIAGISNVCVVRCNNLAKLRPIVGCMSVSMVNGGAGAGTDAGVFDKVGIVTSIASRTLRNKVGKTAAAAGDFVRPGPSPVIVFDKSE